ncbi:MAG: hypothetical protein OXC68_09210 [Aestuariivita sp.]|nr:hypothetical protein [Aestuariivita sp.]
MGKLCKNEHVWRDVYHEEYQKHLTKKDPPLNRPIKQFFGHPKFPIPEISGNLYDEIPLREATQYADARGNKQKQPREVRGWWKISVSNIENSGCKVEPTPKDTLECKNKYHADIFIPEKYCESWEDAGPCFFKLLRHGKWQDRENEITPQHA